MKQWLFLEVPKRIFRCVATASLGGTVAPTGGHTRTPLVISQVFSDGGAEDPATGDSAKFERTEGVPTGAVGNLVPHPELHLGGTFFFSAFFFLWESLGEGGLEGIFHAHHWIRVCSCCCCISLLVSLQQMGCSYAASNFMMFTYTIYDVYIYDIWSHSALKKSEQRIVTCWGRRMRRDAWRHGQV